MVETVTVANMPDSGSMERVSFDLFVYLATHLPGDKRGLDRIQQQLDLFAQCRSAVRGQTASAKGLG